MTLTDTLATLPLMRENGAGGSGPLTLVIHSSQFGQIATFPNPERISHILLMDLPAGTSLSGRAPESLKHAKIETGLNLLSEHGQKEKVFFVPSWLVAPIYRHIPDLAREKIWLYREAEVPVRTPVRDYYSHNKHKLEQAYELMADDTDRHVFACRVKALETGNAGYLPIAPYPEYEHPDIRPRYGDVMLDGGLSDMVGAQKTFAEAVGSTGSIYGFEPIQWMAVKAREQLQAYPQYHVVPAGLADKNGKAEFASLRDSSHLAVAGAKNTLTCPLLAADAFACNAHLGHIDCIKLDIEGAELAALHGAAGIIARDKPRLIICMYHKPEDMWEIPLYIHELAPDYVMHLAHSSAGFTDTILYAAVRDKAVP